jgi:hypothetical protein
LYVDVTKNEAPVITGLPVTVEVMEKEVVERKLHDFTITDPEGDTFTCALTTTPTGGPFDLRRDTTSLGKYSTLFNTRNPDFCYFLMAEILP